jgi:DUF4097 and DUF4098 domain-containing protein YvlB
MLRHIVIAAICSVLICAAARAATLYQYEYQKIIPVEPPLAVTITNPNGTVTVEANTEGKLRIDGVKNIYAENPDEAEFIADHVQMEVAEAEGHITVEPRFLTIKEQSPSFWQKLLGKGEESIQGSVDLIVSVPTDCDVDIYSPAGTVTVSGLRGRVNISGQSGLINVQDILGPVILQTSSGPVSLKDVEGRTEVKANGASVDFYSINGNLEIRNSTGRISGEYVIGDVIIVQAGGDIDLAHVEGDIRLKTTSGRVKVEQDFGALDVSTETGDIDIVTELNSAKDYFVETISGSIRFLVPEASSGNVRLEAGSCEIDAQIPIAIDSFSRTRISGRFGGGGPKISLATISGGITLAEF